MRGEINLYMYIVYLCIWSITLGGFMKTVLKTPACKNGSPLPCQRQTDREQREWETLFLLAVGTAAACSRRPRRRPSHPFCFLILSNNNSKKYWVMCFKFHFLVMLNLTLHYLHMKLGYGDPENSWFMQGAVSCLKLTNVMKLSSFLLSIIERPILQENWSL